MIKKAVLSILIILSMITLPIFAAEDFSATDMSYYEKNTVYSGLPSVGTEETLKNGVRFAVYPQNTDNLQTINSGELITTSFKNGTSSVNSDMLESIFDKYPVKPSTHCGIVCYEWKVRFNNELPSKITIQSRDCVGNWAIARNLYMGFFGKDTIYNISLTYNTITGEWAILKDGVQMPDRQGTQFYGIYNGEEGIKAPQLQCTFKDVNASIDILGAELCYYERSSGVIYEGLPSEGVSDTQNGATFMAAANNYGIVAENRDGEIVAFAGENYASGDYIKFILGYPVTSATHSGSVSYEYKVRFTGSVPSKLDMESRHTKNDWAFAVPIPVNKFTTDTEYIFTLTYDIATSNYVILVKKAENSETLQRFEGVTIGGSEAGLHSPYLQWKPKDATSKIYITNAKVIYTGHCYTLQGATLTKEGENMVANINLYKARAYSVSNDRVWLMVTGYNSDNRMTSFTSKRLSLLHGENELEIMLNEPIENLNLTRILLWTDDMKPLIKTSTLADSRPLQEQSVMNMDYMIENIYLKDTTVFMINSDYVYVDDERKLLSEDTPKPVKQRDTFMIPASLLESVCKLNVSFTESTGKINVSDTAELTLGSTVMKVSGQTYTLPEAPYKENGILYLPFEALMEQAFNKDAYCDERGMLICSDNTFVHKDSEYFLKVFDTIDDIYRYMQYDNPSGETMISDAQNYSNDIHPKITVTNEQREYILDKINSGDNRWVKAKNSAIKNAEDVISSGRVISANPNDSEKQLAAAQYVADMKWLSMAYILTRDSKYADYALENLESAIKWDNLGESTAQLTMGDWAYGTALIFDTFYDYMQNTTEGQKLFSDTKTAVKSLLYKNLSDHYKGKGSSCRWVRMTDNFTGVCGGGVMMLLCALSGEEDMQKETSYLLQNVYKSLQIPLGIFGPDGGWYEGVSYGSYCLTNMADAFVAMKNTFGTLYGLEKAQGFKEIPDFYIYMSTPNASFNFHDMPPRHENAVKSFSITYLTGDVFRMELLKRHRDLSGEEFDIQSLMFYDMSITDKGLDVNIDSIKRDHFFKNAGTGSFISSYTEKNPTFVGFHGGYTGMVHDSMDLGEFIFEADGVMWAYDLGSDNYSMPEYFVIPDGYRHYRKNPQGENCIVINPLKDLSYYGQKSGAMATLVDFESGDSGAKAAFDLSEGYERDVKSYIRGYLFGDNRNTLTVRDEIVLKQNSELYWFVHTPASIEIIDNNTALLTKDGKKCRVEVACSDASYTLKVMEATLLAGSPGKDEEIYGKSNSHVKKIAIHFENAPAGEVDITVKFIPESDNFKALEIDANTSIKSWTLE